MLLCEDMYVIYSVYKSVYIYAYIFTGVFACVCSCVNVAMCYRTEQYYNFNATYENIPILLLIYCGF